MSEIDLLKQRLKVALAYVYGEVPPNQFRDVCMVFCMAWSECLKLHGLTESLAELGPAIRPFGDTGWEPDESWKWWKTPGAPPPSRN